MSTHDRREAPAGKAQRKATSSSTNAPKAAPTPMATERQSAARQINRTLTAWRDKGPGGGGAGGVKIPSGGGGKLPGGLRQSMEKKLGADLSDVNIHTGGDSSAAAKDLNARAFTTGTDVHFGAGEFDPGSKEGKKLLAHELTHVVQAKQSGVSRAEDEAPESEGNEKAEEPTGEKDGEKLEVSDPEEPAEKEADAVAEKVTEGDEAEGQETEGQETEGQKAEGQEAEGEQPEEAPAPVAAKAIPISAKLQGISRKVFRAAQNETQGRAILAEMKRINDLIMADAGNQSWTPQVAFQFIQYKTKFETWANDFGGRPPEGDQIKAEARKFVSSYNFVKEDCTKAIAKAIKDMDAADIKKHEGVQLFNLAVSGISRWRANVAFGENGRDKDPKWAELKTLQDGKQKQIDDWRKVRENAANDPNLTEEQKARLKYELQLEYCEAVMNRIAANQEVLHKIADFSIGRLIDGLADVIKGSVTAAAAAAAGPVGAAAAGYAAARLSKEIIGRNVDKINLAIENARKMNEAMARDALKKATPEQINELATKWQASGTPVISFKAGLDAVGAALKTGITAATMRQEIKKELSQEALNEEKLKRFLTTDVMDNTWNYIGEQVLGTKVIEEYVTAWFVGGSETLFKIPEMIKAGVEAYRAWSDLKQKEKELKARGFAVPT